MAFDLTKLATSITNLTKWVKDGLATKQPKVLTGTAPPANTTGNDGDVFLVTDS